VSKSRFVSALSVGLLILCAGVTQAQPNEPRPLIWAADADGGKPFVLKDPANPTDIIGFEVDLKNALERELGRPIEFKQYDFNEMVDGLERGDFDIAMNGLEITPDRLQRVLFSRPYYIYQQQLVVRTGEQRFKTLDDIKNVIQRGEKITVGTLNNTAAERLLQKMEIPSKAYADQLGLYQELSLGREIQAVLLDLPAALYYAAPPPRPKYAERIANLRFAGAPFAEGYYAIAVRKGNDELVEALNAALGRLIASGELKRIYMKWELWNVDQYRLSDVEHVAEEEAVTMAFADYAPLLLRAALTTVWLSVVSMALAIALGLPIALCRLYGPAPLRVLATVYVEFFRGIPILLLLYFLYFGLPGIAKQLGLPEGSLQLNAYHAALLGFGLNYAAYESEIYRAGISAIPAGQWEAAAALGMSAPVTFRRVILPQAVRTILPPMTNDFVALFKDTSIVSVLAIVELTKEYQILTKSGGGFLQVGLLTALLYLVMSVPLGYLSRYLEQRWGGSR
jgi:His/Glu/Gln/Arg/opine family amino acid ABC transporter permease subunit